jgi:hypothetical protein
MPEPKKINAFVLLEKALEFQGMVPSNWTPASLDGNPPRMIRYQQVSALLKLFLPEVYDEANIESVIYKLFRGDFILKRDIKSYVPLFNIMEQELADAGVRLMRGGANWKLDTLQQHFFSLMIFKDKLIFFNRYMDNVIEASGIYRYPIVVSKKIAAQINTESLDTFLTLAIDPLGRAFTKEELVAEHNYPPEDLDEVDGDWI